MGKLMKLIFSTSSSAHKEKFARKTFIESFKQLNSLQQRASIASTARWLKAMQAILREKKQAKSNKAHAS
ncbi:MAG: hypothetical protein A2452_10550 [Candidatus Firestonebacteria bacterium RIFOXYC2_FULL_39_67]|nr:MAG: hypothetical protein A2452_10550 [Candidatus Firestonebacteria bacterium RIFOXYC2_FULL_39_67]